MEEIDFAVIEKKWQKKWEKEKAFEVKEGGKKEKYYILEQFPYPSGKGLHVGHSFIYTVGDIYARFKRMQGFNVLYPMGFDSFGLPAENAAIKAKSHPKKFTEEAIGNFMKQMKSFGYSYDWSRMVETHKPEFYKWDQWIFLKMLEKDLAYRKNAFVNWCSKCGTVLANEQVINGKCYLHEDVKVEQKELNQWFFRTTNYTKELLGNLDKLEWPDLIKKLQRNWIGKSEGSEIVFDVKSNVSNVIVVHGSNSNELEAKEGGVENTRHWHPWLKKKLEKEKIPFSGELYPVDWNPDYFEWKKVFEKNEIDQNSVLIGHSAGCSFLLRWLSETKKKVRKVILVAPYMLKSKEYPSLDNLIDFDLEKGLNDYVDNFVVFYSDNDSDFIVKSVEHLRKFLDGEFIEKKGAGHFCGSDGFNEFEEIFNQVTNKNWNVFTTRPDTIMGVTFLVVSAQHPDLDSLVSKEQKKDVDQFIKKLGSFSEKDLGSMDKEGVFTGSYAKHPITGDDLPIWAGNFVVADYGSGMVMAVPAHDQRDFEFANKYGLEIRQVIEGEMEKGGAYTGAGKLINSGDFNGLENWDAKEEVIKELKKLKKGGGKTEYKFRDWLVSRQRFWGTPIPIIHCSDCGAVPVPEKDLPVVLPDDIKFSGRKNPLKDYKPFTDVSCPDCGKDAKRETDTMDTFVNSSWYFLRYTDPDNADKIFDSKKANYWMPIDMYVGGKEHATMHDIYFRYYTMFLKDLGLINESEPAKKLFNQGFILGEDGNKMSKSKEHVVLLDQAAEKYGVDPTRFFLVSVASPDSDYSWNDAGAESSSKFIRKIMKYYSEVKVVSKGDPKIVSKINKAVKEITKDIGEFRYNIAVIKIRQLFSSFGEENSKGVLGKFVQLISPFCPHIAEELWSKLGNKGFVSLASWPEYDEKKIDEKLEEGEKAVDKTVGDIATVVNIVKERSGIDPDSVYLYVMPHEVDNFSEDVLKKRTGKDVKVFAVNDKGKYDPEGKAKKAKPGKPGIFVE